MSVPRNEVIYSQYCEGSAFTEAVSVPRNEVIYSETLQWVLEHSCVSTSKWGDLQLERCFFFFKFAVSVPRNEVIYSDNVLIFITATKLCQYLEMRWFTAVGWQVSSMVWLCQYLEMRWFTACRIFDLAANCCVSTSKWGDLQLSNIIYILLC